MHSQMPKKCDSTLYTFLSLLNQHFIVYILAFKIITTGLVRKFPT